jgi:general secretion pathway protein L
VVARGDARRIRDVVQEVAAALDPARTRVQVRVPGSLALSTRPSLPLAAEENLREVLGFEMDRLTPFRSSDVFFAFDVVARDRVKQLIQVQLAVVRRSLVDPLLAGLEQWSLNAAAYVPGPGRGIERGEAVCLDFTPASFRQRSASALNAVLGVVVVALAAYAVYLPVKAQREYRLSLDQALLDARLEAAQAIKVREQLDLGAAAGRTVADAKAARPSAVEVLETVTRLLPDHTHLFRLELRGDSLSIQGSSQAASSLIALLDGSEWLTNVQFASPVTRDPSSGGERFHISARLVARAPAARPGTGG